MQIASCDTRAWQPSHIVTGSLRVLTRLFTHRETGWLTSLRTLSARACGASTQEKPEAVKPDRVQMERSFIRMQLTKPPLSFLPYVKLLQRIDSIESKQEAAKIWKEDEQPENLREIRLLGEGKFGRVRLFKTQSGDSLAIKETWDFDTGYDLSKEFAFGCRLRGLEGYVQHRALAREVVEIGFWPTFIIMDFVEGKTLSDYLAQREWDHLPVVQAKQVADQLVDRILDGLDRGLLPLDFHDENLMVRGEVGGSLEMTLLDYDLFTFVGEALHLDFGHGVEEMGLRRYCYRYTESFTGLFNEKEKTRQSLWCHFAHKAPITDERVRPENVVELRNFVKGMREYFR